jgi:FkbM family methyltransferase
MLCGQYEAFERSAVQRYIDPNLPVIELGGCIGVVACVTNRLLQAPTQHLVVEANPAAITILEESRSRNGCGFRVVCAAVAYGREKVTFRAARDLWTSSMLVRHRGDDVTVPALTLSALIEDAGFGRLNLICDIEGAEVEIVEQDADALRKVAVFILETHPQVVGDEAAARTVEAIRALGFQVVERSGPVVVFARA